MRFRIKKTLNPGKGYPCVFRNWRANSHCNLLHGYDLTFGITLECDAKDRDHAGHVFDFGGFKPLKKRLDDTFDHKLLVAFDDPDRERIMDLHHAGIAHVVEMEEIGCEAFAGWLSVEMFEILLAANRHEQVRIIECRVSENAANSASAFL